MRQITERKNDRKKIKHRTEIHSDAFSVFSKIMLLSLAFVSSSHIWCAHIQFGRSIYWSWYGNPLKYRYLCIPERRNRKKRKPNFHTAFFFYLFSSSIWCVMCRYVCAPCICNGCVCACLRQNLENTQRRTNEESMPSCGNDHCVANETRNFWRYICAVSSAHVKRS